MAQRRGGALGSDESDMHGREPGPDAEPDPALLAGPKVSVRTGVVRGIGWKAVSQTTLQISQIVVTVLLARLLDPSDFGQAGMVLVLANFVYLFTDLAFGSALVQRPGITQTDCSSAFWTSAGVGVLLTLGGIAVSPLVGDFYNDPAVVPLFAALSVNFVIASLGRTQMALLTRAMNFRSLELRSMLAGLSGAAVAIVAAFLGAGPWAIILQLLTLNAVSTLLVWYASPWRPSFVYSRASMRKIGRFSRNVFTSNILFFLNTNADNLIIGKFLGASPLGVYRLSYNVMLQPANRIIAPIRNVLFPAFAKMQDDRERMLAAWVRVNRIISAIAAPMLLGVMVTAPDFVPAVLGPKWHGAVPVLELLAWVGLFQSVQRLNGSVLQACDMTHRLAQFAVIAFVANMSAFLIGVHWGVVGVAAGAALANLLVQPLYTTTTAHALGVTPIYFIRRMSGVIAAAVLMALTVLAAGLGMRAIGVEVHLRLAVEVALGLAVYLPACAWLAPEVRGELGALRRAARRRKRVGVAPESPAAVV